MLRLVGLFTVIWLAVFVSGSANSVMGPSPMQTLSPPGWVLPGATIDMNFASGSYWNAYGSNSPWQMLSTTRSTTTTCTTRGGLLFTVAASTPCITDLGLLAWDAGTNLILQSAINTTGAKWAGTRATLTGAAATSPFGTTDAATLVEDSTATSTHFAAQTITKGASALAYVFSVYAKPGTRSRVDLQLDDAAGNGAIMVCDLTGQQVGVATAGVGTPFTTLLGDALPVGAWTRCTMGAVTNTATSLVASVFLDSGSGTGALSNSYSGDGASGATIFGAQLMQNSFRTSLPYIPTTTAAVARSGDVISYTLPQTAAAAYTLFVQAVSQTPISNTNTPVLASIDAGANTDRMQISRTATTGITAFNILNANAAQYSQNSTTVLAQYVSAKMALSAQAGNQIGVSGTVFATAGAGSLMPAGINTVHFGIRADTSGATICECLIERLAVIPRYITGSGLLNLTNR